MRINLRLARLVSYVTHRKISAFWLIALLSITAPWFIKGCQLAPLQTRQVYNDCAVLSIYDGDNMTVRCDGRKIKVRLYCIDAPEMAQKPWGRQSRDHLRRITTDSVQLVVHTRDRYGREVGEVLANPGSLNLNQSQVQAGQAAEYDRYCKEPVYRDLESAARRAKVGIWSMPGLQQEPWTWRRR